MQTISWDEEIKFIDCLFYDIDFEQDFSIISEIPTDVIIDFINEPKVTYIPVPIGQTSLNWRDRQHFEKMIKKELRREEKWKRNNPKKSTKQAIKDFDEVMTRWGV